MWNAIKAGVLDCPVAQMNRPEGAPMGAALLAGHAVGLFPDLDRAAARWTQRGTVVRPKRAQVPIYRRRLLWHRIGIFLSVSAMAVGIISLLWILAVLLINGLGAVSVAMFTHTTPAPGSEGGGLLNAIVGSDECDDGSGSCGIDMGREHSGNLHFGHAWAHHSRGVLEGMASGEPVCAESLLLGVC